MTHLSALSNADCPMHFYNLENRILLLFFIRVHRSPFICGEYNNFYFYYLHRPKGNKI